MNLARVKAEKRAARDIKEARDEMGVGIRSDEGKVYRGTDRQKRRAEKEREGRYTNSSM